MGHGTVFLKEKTSGLEQMGSLIFSLSLFPSLPTIMAKACKETGQRKNQNDKKVYNLFLVF